MNRHLLEEQLRELLGDDFEPRDLVAVRKFAQLVWRGLYEYELTCGDDWPPSFGMLFDVVIGYVNSAQQLKTLDERIAMGPSCEY